MARKKKIKSPDDFKVGDLVMFVGSGPTPSNLAERKQKGVGIIIENNDGVFVVAYQGAGVKTESYYCVEKYIYQLDSQIPLSGSIQTEMR